MRQNLSSFDYKYENKGRKDSIQDSQQLNVFEDGSMKQSDSIHIIDELLRYKKLYQLGDNAPEHGKNKT